MFHFQLRDSFKEVKKRFSNLKFNYQKRNDRTRNAKAVRNQLQQVELYEEKLQVSPAPDLSLRRAADFSALKQHDGQNNRVTKCLVCMAQTSHTPHTSTAPRDSKISMNLSHFQANF